MPLASRPACGRTSPAAGRACPARAGEQARQDLGLDARPLVLLATNVIGDSLTLGRQVFSQNMTEWLQRTRAVFLPAGRMSSWWCASTPASAIPKGLRWPMWCSRICPDLPEHIHLVAANDPVNTYDLVEIADLGLVYTTTVGMEMAMSGVPVIVAGQTHYRGKASPWTRFPGRSISRLLDQVLADPESATL